MVRDPGCSIPGIVCTEHGSRAAAPGPRGAFEGARVMRTWGLYWDWLERDPDLSPRTLCLFTAPRSAHHGPWTIVPRAARQASPTAFRSPAWRWFNNSSTTGSPTPPSTDTTMTTPRKRSWAADLRMIQLQAHLRDQCLGQRMPGVAKAVSDAKVIVARSRYVLCLDPAQPETSRVFE